MSGGFIRRTAQTRAPRTLALATGATVRVEMQTQGGLFINYAEVPKGTPFFLWLPGGIYFDRVADTLYVERVK